MVRFTIRYSIEIKIRSDNTLSFWIVNTGIGWVAVAVGETLEQAWCEAKAKNPNTDFVLHRTHPHVKYHTGGSVENQLGGTDRASREHQYASVLSFVARHYSESPKLLHDVEQALRLAYPVEPFVATA